MKKPIIFLEGIICSRLRQEGGQCLPKILWTTVFGLLYNIHRQERAKGHTPDTSGSARKESSLSLDLRWCLAEGCSLIYSGGVKRFPRWPHKPETASPTLVSATILQGGGKFSKRLISAYKPERYRTLQPIRERSSVG